MQILLINNIGSGFADYVDVESGTTIETFLNEHLSEYKPADLLIRVNRLPVARDQVLQDGDRISATPTKIDGASPGRGHPGAGALAHSTRSTAVGPWPAGGLFDFTGAQDELEPERRHADR